MSMALTMDGGERNGRSGERKMIRAAQYVRMSTDHQRYSTQNQAAALQRYAEAHEMSIVCTYEDSGKSGLNVEGRLALSQLLSDVISKRADFDVLLVYDVSRWGRFQDADESAHYEYMCRRAGVRVIYCAEQFDNDGSPLSALGVVFTARTIQYPLYGMN